ncbi:MAG: glycosyltransferase family 87 protein [Candidatus Limnocylindrales bacterium]
MKQPGSSPSDSPRGVLETPEAPSRPSEDLAAASSRPLWSRFVPTQSKADTVGFLVAWFVLIAIAVQVAALVIDNLSYKWWPAYDTNAYWLASRHLLDGDELYVPAQIWTAGVFKYPPIYAQLMLPIGLVPETIVDWIWRIVGVMCLRYLAGSWKLAVLASLQWPVFAEIDFGNVTLQLGAVVLMCLCRGRAASAGIYLLPWFAGMKFGPGLLIPYLWMTRPETRRPLTISCAIFAAACLVSFAISSGLWFDYAGTFGWEAQSQMQAMFVYAIVPNHGGLDFAIRFAIAAAAILVAIRWRLDWLAFIAATATMPIFSLTRLAILVGLWPLWLRHVVDRWRQSDGDLQRWLTAPLVYLDMLPPREPPSTGASATHEPGAQAGASGYSPGATG